MPSTFLSGATAVPVIGGGLGNPQGAVTLIRKGNEEEVKKAFEVAELCKGARFLIRGLVIARIARRQIANFRVLSRSIKCIAFISSYINTST
jgi:hypothetical protein